MREQRKRNQRGMILINVLVIVMLATAVLAVMLASEDDDVDRGFALRSAAQAMATARGAELSAVAALRRDLASGSTADTLGEPWANIADRNARIPGGSFSFAVTDAQSRFNINNLMRGDVTARDNFTKIAASAALPEDTAETIVRLLPFAGPLDSLSQLRMAGVSDSQLRRLALLCTALPSPSDVNVNTAPEALLAILFGNEATARSVGVMRARAGGVTRDSMMAGSILMPPGVDVSSQYFWSRSKVTIGDTSQQLTSLLVRRQLDGQPEVVAIRRWRGAAPVEAPPLAD